MHFCEEACVCCACREQGELRGDIVSPVEGPEPFDWDSIFRPKGHDLTLSAMGPEAKNEVSHRRLALDQAVQYLRGLRACLE